ncbi:hypothetical protein XENTR_v10016744 [Xenopus tropicalis]|nr:hypothetical protein XENTR_v10016744 [Xenopus tropicalis]
MKRNRGQPTDVNQNTQDTAIDLTEGTEENNSTTDAALDVSFESLKTDNTEEPHSSSQDTLPVSGSDDESNKGTSTKHNFLSKLRSCADRLQVAKKAIQCAGEAIVFLEQEIAEIIDEIENKSE